MVKSFSKGLACSTQTAKSVNLIPGMDKIGDGSVGIRAIMAEEPTNLQLDMVIAHRGSVGQIVALVHFEGTEPLIPVGDLAQILNDRISKAFGGK